MTTRTLDQLEADYISAVHPQHEMLRVLIKAMDSRNGSAAAEAAAALAKSLEVHGVEGSVVDMVDDLADALR